MKDNNYNVRKREIVDLATKHSYKRVESIEEIPKLKLTFETNSPQVKIQA